MQPCAYPCWNACVQSGVTRTARSGFSARGIRWGVIPDCAQHFNRICIGGIAAFALMHSDWKGVWWSWTACGATRKFSPIGIDW